MIKETKIIFIDVDGPLVSDKWFNSKGFTLSTGSTVPYEWDPKCCQALTRIQDQTKAQFVISSDWRLHYSLDEMRELFWKYSINGDMIIGFTNHFSRFNHDFEGSRTKEINDWVINHRITKWCAIDDMSLAVSNFVMVEDTSLGLDSPVLIEKAINYLI